MVISRAEPDAPAQAPEPESDEARAAREAEALAAAEKDRERRAARLVELAAEAEAAAADESLPAARKRFNVVRREWSDMALGLEVDPALVTRYNDATATMGTRDAAARDEDAKNRKEALARLHNLLGRVEPLAAKPDISLKAADRALRDVKAAFGAMPPLPSKQDFEDVMKRLKDVQAALTPKHAATTLNFSRQWRLQAEAGEILLRQQLLGAVGELVDVAVLAGSGVGGQLLGLVNTANIGTQAGTSLAHAGILAMPMPAFPHYTSRELRRAIRDAYGETGLASTDETRTCAPFLRGHRFTVRHQEPPLVRRFTLVVPLAEHSLALDDTATDRRERVTLLPGDVLLAPAGFSRLIDTAGLTALLLPLHQAGPIPDGLPSLDEQQLPAPAPDALGRLRQQVKRQVIVARARQRRELAWLRERFLGLY